MMNDSSLPLLSLLEIRVLGVLAEKQRTVPDIYPLTLNALVAGCNQKSSRDPIMDVTSIEVQEAIEQLKRLSLVMDSSGGRSIRFAHNLDRVLKIPVQSLALITVLMLRGPQTAGELRINSERLHKFADISSVESFLEELIERSEGPLVMKLPRQPGSRESRWVHLLSGEPEMSSSGPLVSTASVSEVDLKTLRSDIARLEAELVALRKIVEELATRVGFSTE